MTVLKYGILATAWTILIVWIPTAGVAAPTPVSPAASMTVEKVEENAARLTVRTTGATYVFDRAGDRVTVSQRINVQRPVAALTFKPGALKGLAVTKKGPGTCEMTSPAVRITVARDSALFVEPKDAVVKTTPLLADGKSGDGKGGYGLYLSGKRTSFENRYVLSVFPPREFDYDRYFEGRWLWCSEPPSDELLERAHRTYRPRYVHIHKPGWKGWWTNRDFVCQDPERLKRAVKTAHRLDMKVQLYLNHIPGRDTDEKLDEVLRNLPKVKAFNIDGIYWDEIGDTLPLRYRLLTETRRILGPEVSVHIHDSRYYREPFVYTYADWVIGGEHVDFKTIEDGRRFLRRRMSHLNRSNTIGIYLLESRWVLPREFVDEMLASCVQHAGPGLINPDGFPVLGGKYYSSRKKPAWVSRRITEYYYPLLDARKWEHRGRTGKLARPLAQADADKARAEARAWLDEEAALIRKGAVPRGIPLKTVTASKHVGASYPRGFWQPAWATDGSVATGTYMSDKPDAHLTLEFDGEKSIRRILYDTHFPPCKAEDVWQSAFTISVSTDGRTWTAVIRRQGLGKAERFTLSMKTPVRARFLRVHNIRSERRLDPKWHSSYVTEIQAYE